MQTIELEKLKKRLKGCSNIAVDVVEGYNATAEDVAREVNKALDAIAAGDFEPVETE